MSPRPCAGHDGGRRDARAACDDEEGACDPRRGTRSPARRRACCSSRPWARAPRPDLTALTTVDPLHVVAGLPGFDGLTQLENDDPALGRWRTATVLRDTAAHAAPDGPAVGVLPARTLEVPATVPVVDARPGWLRVMVAARGAWPSQSETMDAYDTRTRTSATAFHSTTLRSRGEVSNGCVRLADDVLDVLWRTVPAGTLVVVR